MTMFKGSEYFSEAAFPFHIDKYTIARDQPIPSHTHDFVELVYVLEGSAQHEMAGLTYILHPGDVFVIEPNVYHSFRGASHVDCVVYNVLFERRLLDHELHALREIPAFLDFFYLAPFLRKTGFAAFHPYFKISRHQRPQFEQHLDTLLYESTIKETGYQLIVKTRLIECMVHLSRFFIAKTRTAEPTEDQWIRSITSMLEQYYAQPFTLQQLSRFCGLSISSFTAKFKAHTGKTVIEYKHDLQIREACRLLSDTNRSLLEISQAAGFDDLSFFYRVFRKKHGMTPAQYRRQVRVQRI